MCFFEQLLSRAHVCDNSVLAVFFSVFPMIFAFQFVICVPIVPSSYNVHVGGASLLNQSTRIFMVQQDCTGGKMYT